jgi:hypothetical protein
MPSALSFLVDANTSPYQQKMAATPAIAARYAKEAGRALLQEANFIEQQISSSRRAGLPTAALEGLLAGVKQELATLAVQILPAIPANLKESVLATANWRVVAREVLVVMREIARGNWTRVPGSLSIIIQNLRVSLKTLLGFLPELDGFAILGTIFHSVNRGFKEMAAGAELAADRVGNLNERLRAHSAALRTAAENAATFHRWETNLGERDSDNVSAQANERVRLLQHEFELRQRLADLQNQSPEERAAAQLEEQQRELDVLNQAKTQAQSEAESAHVSAQAAEQRLQGIGPQRENASIAERQANHAAGILAAIMGASGAQTSGSSLRAAWKSNNLPQLFSAFGNEQNRLVNTKVDGKDVSMSMATARANFEAASRQSDSNSAIVRDAEESATDARERATHARSQADRLDEAVQQRQATLAIDRENLPGIASETSEIEQGRQLTRDIERGLRREHGSGEHELTHLQRIGGMYAMPELNEANSIARDTNHTLHQIRDRLTSGERRGDSHTRVRF